MQLKAMITDIQRFSVYDGPGIRTTVFLKGCNLRCLWCHNPETFSMAPQVSFLPERCLGCNECLRVCPSAKPLDKALCTGCLSCVKACDAGARVAVGRKMSIDELLSEVLKDQSYYGQQGGVTFSGGEALLQHAFLSAMMDRLDELGIKGAIETNLLCNLSQTLPLLLRMQLVMCDIKAMDEELHRRLTGAGNQAILHHIRELAQRGVPLIVRTPVIEGCNDDQIEKIAKFLAPLPIQRYELLTYNTLAEEKWTRLNRTYALQGLRRLSDEKMRQLAQLATQQGVLTVVAEG